MAKVSRQRLEFAVTGFLAEMRKQFVRLNPELECPVRGLSEYSPADRSALMAGIEKAIAFARVPVSAATEALVDIRGKLLPAQIVKPVFARNGKTLI